MGLQVSSVPKPNTKLGVRLCMARSLVRNEFTVRGYDIRSEPLERLAVDGGQPYRSAACLAQRAGIYCLGAPIHE